jgi:hydroxymethylpyrimidine pyrophosphatase-like HAD family hydrolase
MAIGDSSNDVEMLAAAGLGIAMGNASAAARAAADEVTASVREDGVLAAFRRHGLL